MKKIILMMMSMMLMNGFSQMEKGACPSGQVDIDDKGTCKKVVKVYDEFDLVAEIREATGVGTDKENWAVNLNYIDTSTVDDMSYLFGDENVFGVIYGLAEFNGRIDKWDVSSVRMMTAMFHGAENFNQDIGKWNVSSVRSMHAMFQGTKSFNQDLSKWDVSNVTDMYDMFTLSGMKTLPTWYK